MWMDMGQTLWVRVSEGEKEGRYEGERRRDKESGGASEE